ncbi:MAG TPA: surface lipoprotein assembly modifier [Flavisolibacter sp.]
MKKFIGLSLLMMMTWGAYAQDSTATTPTRSERKQNERVRRSALSRQQEEGVLSFSKHTAFGVQIRTNGYGVFLELGRSRSPRFTNLYLLEITEIKHPKEERVSNANAFFSNSFIYGKINNFYQAKLGFGQQYVFGQKGNKNGVAVLAIVHAGLSLGFLKPYYLQVQEQSTGAQDIKYDSKDSLSFLDVSKIIGGSGFSKGWNELKMKPGAFVKTSLRFDFGRFNETIQALEIGMSVDAYASKIPQMVFNEPKRFFFQGHIALVFGHRK